MRDRRDEPAAEAGDIPEELRSLVDGMRADAADAGEMGRLAARLAAAAQAGPPGGVPSSSAGVGSIGLAVVAAVVVTAAIALWPGSGPDARSSGATAELDPVQAVGAGAARPSPSPVSQPSRATLPTLAPPALPGPSEAAAGASPAPRRRVTRESATTPAVAPAPAAESPEDPALAEGALLRRARGALPADPALALRLTDEHRRQFAAGVLGQEREVIAIDALVALGRSAEARQRAAAFLSANQASPHRRRIEAVIAAPREAP